MAKKPTQVEGSKQLPPIFYRKVIRTTNGRLLNLTPVIPKDWRLVKVRLDAKDSEAILLTIYKLAGENSDAQSPTGNQHNQQDTSETG